MEVGKLNKNQHIVRSMKAAYNYDDEPYNIADEVFFDGEVWTDEAGNVLARKKDVYALLRQIRDTDGAFLIKEGKTVVKEKKVQSNKFDREPDYYVDVEDLEQEDHFLIHRVAGGDYQSTLPKLIKFLTLEKDKLFKFSDNAKVMALRTYQMYLNLGGKAAKTIKNPFGFKNVAGVPEDESTSPIIALLAFAGGLVLLNQVLKGKR
jgi:hypothetical protein